MIKSLLHKFRAGHKLRAGFSLAELLVVIAVIAVLAAIVLPQILGTTQAARNSAALETRNIANRAIENYIVAGGSWFTTATSAATANSRIVSAATDNTGVGIVVAGSTVSFALNQNPSATLGVSYSTAASVNRYTVQGGSTTGTAANVTEPSPANDTD
jgi:type IV pilus assembly protein PilA